MTLDRKHDAMGAAIRDYHLTGRAATLRVCSEMFDEDEIPVPYLFRTLEEMPPLEQRALKMAHGKVLDIGAGAGCHSLALQQRGLEVTAIDISPLSCEVMTARGVKDVRCCDVMNAELGERFDTILLLMNGIGMAGTVERLPLLLKHLKSLLAEGGQIITDSSDLKYIYENEDGTFDIDPADGYYGEVDYQMIYRDTVGVPFDWLYIDFSLLQRVAEVEDLRCELLAEGEHYDYLARLCK